MRRSGFCLRGVGTPAGTVMEEGEDREWKEEESSSGEGRMECLEAAREEGVEAPEAGMGRGSWVGWVGRSEAHLHRACMEIADTFILWPWL